MLPLLSLVLPCLGPQADESGGDSVGGLRPLNSRCSHTETGRVLEVKARVGKKTKGSGAAQLGLSDVLKGLGEKPQMCR